MTFVVIGALRANLCKFSVLVKELGFLKLAWHNCPVRNGLTSEIVRTTLLQYF